MLQHQWGYQFGILHQKCFIELCPSHQGSPESFGVPEATVSISATSKNMTVCCFLKDQPEVVAYFIPTNQIYLTGAFKHIQNIVCRSSAQYACIPKSHLCAQDDSLAGILLLFAPGTSI